jgi:hypothetical protein
VRALRIFSTVSSQTSTLRSSTATYRSDLDGGAGASFGFESNGFESKEYIEWIALFAP